MLHLYTHFFGDGEGYPRGIKLRIYCYCNICQLKLKLLFKKRDYVSQKTHVTLENIVITVKEY